MQKIRWGDVDYSSLGWIAWALFLIYVVPTLPGQGWVNYLLWGCIAIYVAYFSRSVWRAVSASVTQESK